MKHPLAASILLVLSLQAIILLAGLSAAAAGGNDRDNIRLPSEVVARGKRPWECCDVAVCTRSIPPQCRCTDKVKSCAAACKECEKVEGESTYRCLDIYVGDPGPECN